MPSIVLQLLVEKMTHHQLVLEIPSCLAHPLAYSIATMPMSGSFQDTSYYPTWKLASTDLHAVLDSLWESLEPETKKKIGNVELLPIINNPDSLPYHDYSNNDTLFVENLPECLIPRQKLTSKDKISCLFCGEGMTLNKMRNHVGSHILCALRNTKDPKVCHLGSIGENPCGFCGQDSCFTQLKLKNMVAFQLHLIAHFTILRCSTKKQQSSPRFYHAQMYQFIVLYAPLLSLVILLLYGNIMPCII